MAKTNSSGRDTITTTVRLPAADIAWLSARAEEDRRSVNDLVRQWVADYRTFYGLPDNLRRVLEADAKSMGKDIREYLVLLLGLRYEELWSAKGKRQSRLRVCDLMGHGLPMTQRSAKLSRVDADAGDRSEELREG